MSVGAEAVAARRHPPRRLAAGAPRVSVVMPVHNVADYVEDAVHGILAQGYADFELIVVDDGSTDGTADLVAGIDDPRIRLVRIAHTGLVGAENHGLALAAGEFVSRADGDDLYLPELLERQVAMLDERPALAAVGVWDREFGGRQRCNRTPTDPRAIRRILRHSNTMSQPVMARADAVRAVGGFRDVVFEDWDLWVRLAARHELGNVPEILMLRRVLPSSWSRSPARLRRARARLELRRIALGELGLDVRSAVGLARAVLEVAALRILAPLVPPPPPRPEPTTRPPTATVVVDARGGAVADRCLAGLKRQRPAPEEVVVLHDPGCEPAMGRWAAEEPGRWRAQAAPPSPHDPLGLLAARPTGEVVARLDAAVAPLPGWLAELRRGFLDPTVAAVGGHVGPVGPDADYADAATAPAANFAARRAVLDRGEIVPMDAGVRLGGAGRILITPWAQAGAGPAGAA